MTRVDLIARILEAAGVRWVFGIPSGPVLPLIEALRKSSIEFVLTASETSAGFMATTAAYLSGTPGVCVATVGPGATNLSTGVGAAWLDRVSVLAITCNVATPWLERRTQMRIDHRALFKPLTKATFSLSAGGVGSIVAEALAIAQDEPPGPVHLDLPEDAGESRALEPVPSLRPPGRLAPPGHELIDAVAAALGTSRRPLLVTGLAFTRALAPDRLLTFIERQKIPFVTTLHAKGFLPETHPNWAGVLGRARRTDVKRFTDRADLILAIGYDPVEINYEEWVGSRPVLHLSTETAEAGDRLDFRANGACDLDEAIAAMNRLPLFENQWRPAEWHSHRDALERALRPAGGGFAAHAVLDILRDKLPPDGILAYDVGAHTHQIATQWRSDLPRTLLATNGWSSMGFGMPAGYAAKLVHPDRCVVSVVGDGCFQMTAGELSMARRLNLTVPVVVLNDGWLALMKIKQERRGYPLCGVHLGAPPESPPHYFGVPCRAARNETAFADALDWALGLSGPSVIEAFIEADSYSATVFDEQG